MGREDDRRPSVAQPQNLLLEQIGVDRIEAREGFVEDQQLGFVQHRDDKLDLLRHSFRQLLDPPVPPRSDVEPVEPQPQTAHRHGARQPLEPREKEGLFTHFHLFVKTALLGQIADPLHVGRGERPSIEEHMSLIGCRNAVDDADERRLSRAVGSQQTVHRAARDVERHVVERRMTGVMLRDVFDSQ